MKCSSDATGSFLKISLLVLISIGLTNGESVFRVKRSDISDFDHLISQLYLQHCTFVEIGEGICSLFLELNIPSCKKPLRKQMFLGNCLCSEFRQWHLCSPELARARPQDCEFLEGTSSASSSARVHRRLCDVTGMNQWNSQCNCSVKLAGKLQDFMCGFKTCYASPLPDTICGPRTVCGTAHCDVGEHGSVYSVHCDRQCRYHQPFCEDPCPETSLRRVVTSQWAEWTSTNHDRDCGLRQFETDCLSDRGEPAFDCLGPGLQCCGTDEFDCTCLVKIQDGKLKALRYIKLGDIQDKTYSSSSEDEADGFKRKARSPDLKGGAKVWSRLIEAASSDNKNDSISMFGKPLENEDSKKYLPQEHEEDESEIVNSFLENQENSKDRRQEDQKTSAKEDSENETGLKSTFDKNLLEGSKLRGKNMNIDSERIPANQTIHELKAGFYETLKVNPNENNIVLINPKNNSESVLPIQLKEKEKIDKTSSEEIQFDSTPLLVTSRTTNTEFLKQNNSNGIIVREKEKNISDANRKVTSNEESLGQKSKIIDDISNNTNIRNENSNINKLGSDKQTIDSDIDIGNDKAISQNLNRNTSKETVSINRNSDQKFHLEESHTPNLNISLPETYNSTQSSLKSLQQVSHENVSESTNPLKSENNSSIKKEGNTDQKHVAEEVRTNTEEKFKEKNDYNIYNAKEKTQDTNFNGRERNELQTEKNNTDKVSEGRSSITNGEEIKGGNQDSKDGKPNKDILLESVNKTDNKTKKQEPLLGGIIKWNKSKNHESRVVDEEEKAELEEGNQPEIQDPLTENKIPTYKAKNNLKIEKFVERNSTKLSTPIPSKFHHRSKQGQRTNVDSQKNYSAKGGNTSSDIERYSNSRFNNSTTKAILQTIVKATSSPAYDQSTKRQLINKKTRINNAVSFSNAHITLPARSTNRRLRQQYLNEKRKGVTLNIQTMTTPNFLGDIAKKLSKSQSLNSLNDPNDPFRTLSESNPPIQLPPEESPHDYDEPEPVLKDLNKVDKDNVDMKMAEALASLGKSPDVNAFPGKIEWSEKVMDKDNLKIENDKKKKTMHGQNIPEA